MLHDLDSTRDGGSSGEGERVGGEGEGSQRKRKLLTSQGCQVNNLALIAMKTVIERKVYLQSQAIGERKLARINQNLEWSESG